MVNSSLVRPDARIWDFSSTHSTIAGPAELDADKTMSRIFSMDRGSADSLRVSVQCGFNAKACQRRPNVLWLRPQRRAIDPVFRWVEYSGIVFGVRASTRSTSA